jgi:hypothetical protein
VNKHLIYTFIIFCVCLVACDPVANQSSGEDQLKQSIRNAAGTDLLNVPDWQYRNYTKPDGESKVYGKQLIDQALLRTQIVQVLRDNNIEVVPAVRFRLERPPYLLVISPRARIEYLDRALLSPEIKSAKMAEIERRIDNLEYSSLVVEIGGLGAAYPAIVSPDMGTRQIINAAVEEWAHQFLAMRPLGSLYLLDSLGVRQPAGIIIMNESLAGMVADEIGAQVYDRYYKQAGQTEKKFSADTFNFASEMRETRYTVDMLLNAGEIEAAEQYMEKRRAFFEQNGYPIRKLNQAYFAFHGIYADDPGAVSPVHAEFLKLRQKYSTLAGFVNDASAMTGYSQLKDALSE